MELMPGYKHSNLGAIPENWTVESLGDLADFVTSGSRGWAQFYSEYGALFIRSQNVRDGLLRFDDIQYVSPPSGAEGNRTKVELNDLLITITGNSVGNVALVDQVFDEAYISQHVGLVRLKDPTKGEYICRYLSPNSPGNSQIAGSQSGQSKPGLNLQNLKEFLIALPPSSVELHAITSALSDVDALLATLDQVIAKKRDLKQAAMQQLLTGKTRLPGFSGEWTVRFVKDFGEIVTGGTPSTENKEFWGEGYPWITPTDISTERDMITSERTITHEGLRAIRLLPANTVLVTCIASIGKNAILRSVGGCNQQINAIIPNDDNCAEFLYFLMEANKQYLLSNAGTTATAILSKAAFSEMEFLVPAKPEQTAIAAVLSGMDEELSALETRRDKTRNLKQAMMQELLTGKTRLV